MSITIPKVSIIIPACNESKGLQSFLPELIKQYPSPDYEVIIVNDGSTDDTAHIAKQCGARVISHPYQIGNGAAIKSGARAALGSLFVFMDADGQHDISNIEKLLNEYPGYDMVVGSRSKKSQASFFRWCGNRIYNALATHLVNQPILDLTSGFRIVNAHYFKEFLYLLPNGFSYPSTITMAFFRNGYSVKYVPILVHKRIGKSHLKPLSDGVRFFIIIYKITTLYSPLKIFIPFSFLYFIAGLCNYAYTYTTQGRFTNMSAILFSTAMVVFLIGLISEQITTLRYQKNN